jgi:hypothetical protein
MIEAGAKRVVVRSPEFAVLSFNEVGVPAGDPSVIYGGVEDG